MRINGTTTAFTPLLTILLAALAGTARPAGAVPEYTVRDLGAIGIEAEAHAINSGGLIVGLSYDTIAAHLAVRFENPSPVPLLMAVGHEQAQAVGVNDTGLIASLAFSLTSLGGDARITDGVFPPIDIAGFIPRAIDAQGRLVGAQSVLTADNIYSERAAWWDGTTRIELPAFSAADWSIAHGIDSNGRIVGSAIPGGGLRPRAIVWDGGQPADLGTLGGVSAQALATNNNGGIVGVADTAAGFPHAFLFRTIGATVTERIDLGAIGGDSSAAYDVNDAEQIVGASFGRAFLWEAGTMHDLNTVVVDLDGWDLQTATAINNAGVIVGHGVHAPYGRRAFVLEPVTACAADLTGDGILDLADINAFVQGFVGQLPVADITGDGIFDLADINAFVAAFVAGCP